MPVFSHWQGRLDPRVMILGRTRRGTGLAETGEGPSRGRGLRWDTLPPPAQPPPDIHRIALPGTAAQAGIMKVRNFWPIGHNYIKSNFLLESTKFNLFLYTQEY